MKKSVIPNHKGKRVMKHSKKRKKMDVDGAMGIHFEQDIIMDILTRLPVRSLLRFKCVSKFWMTLISEPYFTVKHLNLAKNNQNCQKILFLNKESSLQRTSLSSVQLVEDVQKLDWPFSGKPWKCKLYCCYNGLALIGLNDNTYCKPYKLFLWNPSTRESILLPRTEFSEVKYYTWGLGYDSTSGDYKIFKINHKGHSEILALKSGSWRKIDKHCKGVYPVLSDMDSLAFAYGSFHWLDLSLNNSVVSFSISNEVYREIPLFFKMDYIKYGVSVLEGMLCVYSTQMHSLKYTFKLWVMKEYGVKESWNQLFTIQGTGLYAIIPEYMFSDGEVLLRYRHLKHDGSVFKTSKESSVLWPQSDSECIQNGFVYTESLICPKLLT